MSAQVIVISMFGRGLLTLTRTIAEISWGEKVLVSPRYSTWTRGLVPCSTTLKGHDSISFLTMGSLKGRPIRRLSQKRVGLVSQMHVRNLGRGVRGNDSGQTYLTSKTVFRGFMAAWFLAASPINRSFSLKETYEGVVKLPCSLAMISTLLPS